MVPGTPRRVVFFDVAGTLLRVRGSVGEQYAALARRFGIAAGADALDSGFGPAFRAASPMAFPGASPEAVPALERDWWRRLVRGLFEDVGFLNPDDAGRFDDYFAALYAHFATAAAWEVYADVRPLLRTLRERGCRTGVVTNFDGRIGPLLAEVGLAPWFDSVTVASEVGVAKPDPAIFRHALALHGAEPGEAIHVGDSPAEDVAGAAAAGLLPVLVDRGNRHAEVAAPGVRVTSLTEVACFLRIPE